LKLAGLAALEASHRFLVASLHTQDATPGIRGLTGVADRLLPQERDLSRKLGAHVRLTAAQDLILVELDHAAMIGELRQQIGEFLREILITGREVVEALQVGGGSLPIPEIRRPKLGALAKELSDHGAIGHLLESMVQRALEAAWLAGVRSERIQELEGRVLDVDDDRLGEPTESEVEIPKVGARKLCRSTQERGSRSPAVTRALTTGRERLDKDPQHARLPAMKHIDVTRGLLNRRERRLLYAAAKDVAEKLPGAVERAPLRSRGRRPNQRVNAILRTLAAEYLTLVEVHNLSRLGEQARESSEQRRGLRRLDRVEGHLSVLKRLHRVDANSYELFRLMHEHLGSRGSGEVARGKFVHRRQRLEITKLNGDPLEPTYEFFVCLP
jgi:hypothetical protein